MDNHEQVKETGASYSTSVTNLGHPIILEHEGQPVAVLMNIEEYEHYQALLEKQEKVSAPEARRAADHAVFGNLVGCALSSGQPTWISTPEPRWRVPYRSFDGALLAEVDVDARTGAVSLTNEERTKLLEQVERLVIAGDASA